MQTLKSTFYGRLKFRVTGFFKFRHRQEQKKTRHSERENIRSRFDSESAKKFTMQMLKRVQHDWLFRHCEEHQ